MKRATPQLRELKRSKLLYRLVKMLSQQEWLRISEEELADIKEMKNLLEEVNPVNPSGNNRPLVLLYHFNTLALCQYMLHDTDAGSVYSQKILYLWKTHPDLIEGNASLFLNAVNTTCYNDFLCHDISQVKENMSVYKLLAHLYLKEETKQKYFEIIRFNAELKLLHNALQYDEIEKLVSERGEEIVSMAMKLLSPPEAMPVIGSVCISWFVLEQWDKAETLLNEIKELNNGAGRLDILYFTSLFHPVILYEKEDWHAMNKAINQSIHDLGHRNLLRPFEHKFMLFLKSLSGTVDAKAAEMIASFMKELNKFSEVEKNSIFCTSTIMDGWRASGEECGTGIIKDIATKLSVLSTLSPLLRDHN